MTDLAKKIFDRYEVRKSKSQKLAFESFLRQFSEENGYSFSVETGPHGLRNLVIGEISNAKAVFSAHYDTCVKLLFANRVTPTCIPLYLGYQIGIGILLALPALLTLVVLTLCSPWIEQCVGSETLSSCLILIVYFAVFAATILLLQKGPANPHTANDNTSGVMTLLEIMLALQPQEKQMVAFVFFDQEEAGMLGSKAFVKAHKAQMADRLLLNFDCVSDGDHVLLILRKKATSFAPYLKRAFLSDARFQVKCISKGAIYTSDQTQFVCGVGVAVCRKKGRLLFIGRIHTRHDTVYREENIHYLAECSTRLLSLLP